MAEYDKTVALPDNAFTCSGYTFKGWSLTADGSGKLIKNKAKVKNLITAQDTVDLYAQWQVNTYSVKFNANKGKAYMPPGTSRRSLYMRNGRRQKNK